METKNLSRPGQKRGDLAVYDHRDLMQFVINTAGSINPGFAIDDDNRPAIEALCLYFANDLRFEKEGLGSLDKGIMLVGCVGTGKTLLMKALKDNPRQRFNIVSTNKITNEYQSKGIDTLGDYCIAYDAQLYASRNLLETAGICFDDLGSERISVKHMGVEMNCMEQIILARHEKQNIPFWLTHFTTNLTAEEIEALYGTRVRSRLREMVNFIELPGKDRRI